VNVAIPPSSPPVMADRRRIGQVVANLCKGIIESHGGRIWAKSPGEGERAAFSFTLPIASDSRT
jgi:signal transduction histidine kinase